MPQDFRGFPEAPSLVLPSYLSGGPDAPPAIAHPLNDEFNGTLLDPKWNWANQSTTTATFAKGSIIVTPPIGNTDNLRTIYQQTPLKNWTLITKISYSSAGADFHKAGIAIRDTGVGKSINWMLASISGVYTAVLFRYNNDTTYTSQALNTTIGQRSVYLAASQTSGSSISFFWSLDGINWTNAGSDSLIGFLGSVGFVGLTFENHTAATAMAFTVDYFRVTQPNSI